MTTPIFDHIAALYPEIQIDVHEDTATIVDFGGALIREVAIRHELTFNYNEPLPIMRPFGKAQPWE